MKFLIFTLVFGFGLMSFAQESKTKLPAKKSSKAVSSKIENSEAVVVRSQYDKQLITKKDFKSISPQLGFVFSDLYGGDSEENNVNMEAKTGLSVGASFDIDIQKNPYLLEAGVFYKQMGAKIKGSLPNNVTVSGKAELNYLALPVYLKSYRELNASAKSYLKAGVIASLLVHDEMTSKASNGVQTVTLNQDANLGTRKIDLGPSVGAGLKMKPTGVGSYEYILDANYYVGFLQVDTGGQDIYNHALSLNLGLSYQ